MFASCSVRRISEPEAGKDSSAVTEPKTDIQTAVAPEITQHAETEAPAEISESARITLCRRIFRMTARSGATCA